MSQYLELCGEKEAAFVKHAAIQAALGASAPSSSETPLVFPRLDGTYFDQIRDPYKYIILPMLAPVPIEKILDHEIVYYNGEFYGSDRGREHLFLIEWDPNPGDIMITHPSMIPKNWNLCWECCQTRPIKRFLACFVVLA